MKTRISFCITCLFVSLTAYGQTDTLQYDTAAIMLEEDIGVMNEPPPMIEMMATEAAIASDDYVEYNAINKFRHSKKIKTEEKPDKKAVYSLGTGELLKTIADNVRVPYGYGDRDQYVILQFVVGKDSLLYNLEILYSPGSEYSINATAVIEKLDYQFLPAMKNGKPVDTMITIPIRFEQKSSNDYRYRSRRHH